MAEIRLFGATTKDELNPDLWRSSGVGLHDNIRNALLKICDEFHKYLKVDQPYKDAVISAEQATYMWNKTTPIRMFLIIDIPDEPWTSPLYHAKKELFVDRYEFDIKGYSIDIAVISDISEIAYDGIFSLVDQSWMRKPSVHEVDIDRDAVIRQVQYYINFMERIQAIQNNDQKFKAGMKLVEKFRLMKDKKFDSIFHEDYLVYKSLTGMNKISDFIDDLIASYSEKHSIQEGIYRPKRYINIF